MRSLGWTLIAAALGTGCVVTSNPDFTQPQQTPPFLTNLAPAPFQVRNLPRIGASGMFPLDQLTFEIVSEDLQRKQLQALLFLDFAGFSEPYTRDFLWQDLGIPPGHLNDPPRSHTATIFFDKTVLPGCHSATLAVSHAFQRDLQTGKIFFEGNDVATATWWYDLDPDPTRSDQLTSCVSRSVTTGDAGADAAESGAP